MAGRPGSNGLDSSTSSNLEMSAISVNKNTTHPEEWTLPHEWNIEKREVYGNWKVDVQNVIANLASSLDKSLNHYPHPEVGSEFNYRDEVEKAGLERRVRESERKAGNTMVYGLARSQHADRR